MTVSASTAIAVGVGALAAWELGWYLHRRARRGAVYAEALAESRRLNRRLVVIGAPDGGVTNSYGCGDVTIDINHSTCPTWLSLDITKTLPFKDDSVVVFCSCVLEYVADPQAAIAEIARISGGHSFFVGVEPWTLTAVLYPGARQTLAEGYR